jgi:hypothetical protein
MPEAVESSALSSIPLPTSLRSATSPNFVEGGVRRNLSPGPPGEMGRGDGARGGAEHRSSGKHHLSASSLSSVDQPRIGHVVADAPT